MTDELAAAQGRFNVSRSRCVDQTLIAVLDLHSPKPPGRNDWNMGAPGCEGCPEDCDKGFIEWPCPTFLLIESGVDDLRKRPRRCESCGCMLTTNRHTRVTQHWAWDGKCDAFPPPDDEPTNGVSA